ncbi:MAG: recombinase family protein [Clostridia bacterium]
MMKEIIVMPATIDNRIFGNKNKIMRVASYSRVSTNFEEQLSSFHMQKSYYTDLILKTKGWKLAGTYADEGISGVTDKRPDFQKLMRHCKAGKIDLIITKSISRFSRDHVLTLESVRKLKSIGVAVYFEKENINTLEENSELVLAILASIAQEESNSISQNVRRGIQMRMQNGYVKWNYKQMYGFRKGLDGDPEIIPEDAEIIRKIYNYYLSGESEGNIAKRLSDEKILTPSKKSKWIKSTVERILQNERYCGDVILQKSFVENHRTKKVIKNTGQFPKIYIKNNHKSIVSREVYDRAIKERAHRNNIDKSSKNAITEKGKYSSKYALGKILVCGDCMSHYKRVVWTKLNKEKLPVWRCIKRVDYGTKYCHSSVTLDEESLHKAIMLAINNSKEDRYNIIEMVKRETKLTLLQNESDGFNLEQAEQQINEITNKIADLVASGNITDNLDVIRKMNAKAVEFNAMIDAYKEKHSQIAIDKTVEDLEDFLTQEKDNYYEYDDVLVRQIIHRIKVESATKIVVVFKNGFEYEQEMKLKIRQRI